MGTLSKHCIICDCKASIYSTISLMHLNRCLKYCSPHLNCSLPAWQVNVSICPSLKSCFNKTDAQFSYLFAHSLNLWRQLGFSLFKYTSLYNEDCRWTISDFRFLNTEAWPLDVKKGDWAQGNSHWFHKAIKADFYSISVRFIADDFQGLKLKTFFQLLLDYWLIYGREAGLHN